MTNSNGFAGPSSASFGSIGHEPVRVKPAEAAAARRMIAKYAPEEVEVELRLMLGVHHD